MSPLQRATIWSMAASFDLEIIENSPIERRDKSFAAGPVPVDNVDRAGLRQPRWARPSHRKRGRHAYIKTADDGFMKTRAPRVPHSEKNFDCPAAFLFGPAHVIET